MSSPKHIAVISAKAIKVKLPQKVIAEAEFMWELLTSQERNVAKMMAIGMSNDDIAAKLSISKKTLDIHRANIKHAFGGCDSIGVPIVVLAATGIITSEFEI